MSGGYTIEITELGKDHWAWKLREVDQGVSTVVAASTAVSESGARYQAELKADYTSRGKHYTYTYTADKRCTRCREDEEN